MRRLALIAAAAASLLVLAPSGNPGAPVAQGGEQGERRLPDLVQILPSRLEMSTRRSRRGTRTLLAFWAAAENHGVGPLIVRGSRPSRKVASMTAEQLVRTSDGGTVRIPNVGRLEFHHSPDHSHWHLLGFMRYELRSRDGRTLRRDRKSGFCLGDRYDGDPAARFPGEPDGPVYTSRCGLSQPNRLSLTEGISIGYGDDYPARLEGQYLDITGLPSGRYVLVQRVNPGRPLADLHEDNDTASMAVKIVRGRSGTRARILDWCSSSATCPAGTTSSRRR